MPQERLRVGVIGVGQIGTSHLNQYAKMDDVDIVAVADVSESALATAAENFGIEHTYIDCRQLLERDDLVAVDVCLHNNLHAPISIAAMQAGKDVYCEKPIAGAYLDGAAMLKAAKECGRRLSIQLNQVFAKETKTAKRLIDAGKLGRPYHARSCGHRRRGRPYVDGYGTANFVQKRIAAGGALFDMGIYHISRMLYLLGMPEVVRVSGKIYQETGMDAGRRAASGYDVEELGLGLVRFTGGVTLDIIESWAIHLNPFEGSSIVGPDGGIRLDPFSYHTTVADTDMDATFDLACADVRRHRLNENEDAFDSPQRHWVAVLQGRAELLPTAELALQTMLISEGIYLSDRLEREVTADEVNEHSVSTALAV